MGSANPEGTAEGVERPSVGPLREGQWPDRSQSCWDVGAVMCNHDSGESRAYRCGHEAAAFAYCDLRRMISTLLSLQILHEFLALKNSTRAREEKNASKI